MERRTVRAVAILLFALLGCANPQPAPPEKKVEARPPAPIRTDRDAYVLRNSAVTITGTFSPLTGRRAYLTHCNGAQPMGLQRLAGGKWVTAWVAMINACFSAPIAVDPGKQHTARLVIAPGAGAITYPLDSGTYRVVWFGVLASFDQDKPLARDELPLEERVSAPFRMEVEPRLAATPPQPSPGTGPIVSVNGEVVDARGMRVAHANVLVRAADDLCRPTGTTSGARTDESGAYVANVSMAAGGCVVVEARSGGASGLATSAIDSARARVDVRLERPAPISPAAARRMAGLLAAAINDPASDASELEQYVLHGPEALRVALQQYRTILGTVAGVQPVSALVFDLQGANGRTSRVEIHQEDLIRIHSPLLDYGFRAERFLSAYLRAISSGDAELLSRVLNPDDIDFPVPRAREIIVDYRRRYRDTATIRPELVDVDERRHVLRWQLRGTGPGGEEVVEPVELGFGDGLIGMRGR